MKKNIQISILFLFCASVLLATPADDFFRAYPSLRSMSNVGTEFYFTVPPALTDGIDANDFVYVAVTSQFTTRVELSVPKKNYAQSQIVYPGESAVFKLTPDQAQPYLKSGFDPEVSNQYIKNGAIHLTSEQPVSAKVLVDYRDSEEGFLLYPTSILANRYCITSFNDGSALYPIYNSFPSMTAIVSLYDNNEVTFTFKGSGLGGGVNFGKQSRIVLNKGDVWMLSSQGKNADLSGSWIDAKKPVSVISACQSANIPVNNKWHNYIIEMETPRRYWGNEYHVASLRHRNTMPILRLYTENETAADTTIVYAYGNTKIDTLIIEQNSAKYGSNFIEYRPQDKNIVLTSDKNFFVAQYNTGVEEDGFPQPEGSPFQLSLTPTSNYGTGAVFSIENSNLLSERKRYYLMMFLKDYDENKDSINMGRYLNTDLYLESIFEQQVLEYHAMPAPNENDAYLLIEITTAGDYVIDSDVPFAAYVYAYTDNASFAYQAVMNLSNITSQDKYPPLVTVQANCPDELLGKVCDKPDDDLKRANLTSVVFDMKNFDRTIDPIEPGTTVCANWQLNVRNNKKEAEAFVLFRDYAGNDTVCYFEYVPPQLEISPKAHNFGAITKNKTISHTFQLTNTGIEPFHVDKIALKNTDVNFTIKTAIPDTLLAPQEQIQFEVAFMSNQNGTFIDSVGIGNDCYFEYVTKVEATVGEPIIEATDVSFSMIEVTKSDTNSTYIFNSGVSELIITGWDLFGDDVFKPLFNRDISNNDPLILKAGETFNYKVECSPIVESEYEGYIVFHSNATQTDSIANFYAKGITVGLSAISYDFQRCLINRSEFPIIPYPIENEYEGIKIHNIGKKNITINNIEIINAVNDEAFEFNRNQLRNLTIAADADYILPIRFNPKDTGYYELHYAYRIVGESELKTYTKLTGIGTVPKIETEDINFGDLPQTGNYVTRQLEIRNLSNSIWQWADSLYLYDLESVIPGAISFDPRITGTENFYIDMQAIDFSKPILPGESIKIDVKFLAYREGLNEAYLNIISDAFNQDAPPIKISAYVISNNVAFSGGSVNVCPDETSRIIGMISNNTQNTVIFEPISFIDDDISFQLINTELLEEFTLTAGQTQEVELKFTAFDKLNKETTILLKDKAGYFTKEATFRGNTERVERSLSCSPITQQVLPGKKCTLSLLLQKGQTIDTFGVYEAKAYLHYNPQVLGLQQSGIQLGEELKGDYDFVIKEMDDNLGYVEIDLYSINNTPIDQHGSLFELEFDVLLPSGNDHESNITFELVNTDGTCVEFGSALAMVKLDDFCADEIRRVQISGHGEAIKAITPNPISNTAIFEISIAFDGQTVIDLYPIDGGTAINIFSSELTAGDYELNCNVGDIATGIYFASLKTSYGISYRKVIILK